MQEFWQPGSRLRALEGKCLVLIKGTKIELTPIEFRLLCHLTDNVGKTCDVNDIMLEVWDSAQYTADVVRWHVASLRGKIEENPKSPQRIITVWGVGYRYEGPPVPPLQ